MNRGSLAAFSLVLASSLAAMVGISGCGSEPPHTATGATGGSSVNPGRAGSGGAVAAAAGAPAAGRRRRRQRTTSPAAAAAAPRALAAVARAAAVAAAAAAVPAAAGAAAAVPALPTARRPRADPPAGAAPAAPAAAAGRTRRSGAGQRQPELRRASIATTPSTVASGSSPPRARPSSWSRAARWSGSTPSRTATSWATAP